MNNGVALKVKTGFLVRALLQVPLMVGDQVVGVLAVDNQQSDRVFSENDQYLLATLADYAAIAIENASFEAPAVDPNGFGAWPFVDGWLELDLDLVASANTGVFANTPVGSPDRMLNADGRQLAFLGSQRGNALEQDLTAVYKAGCDYRLTVAVGVSSRFAPAGVAVTPAKAGAVDTIEVVLYYLDGAKPVDIAHQTVEAKGLSSTQLRDFSVYLSTVQPGDAWAGKPMGVAIRAAGKAGGFWDLDNVRLAESLPVLKE